MAAKEEHERAEAKLDLDIQQNVTFQRREWRVERLGWLMLALLIVAGLLGFLGPGPFSETTADSGNGSFQVEYQRITHNLADDTAIFSFSPDAIEDGKVTLELTGDWVSGVDIAGISPVPSTQYAIPEGIAMEFEVLEPGDLQVVFQFRAQDYWLLDAQATVGEDSVDFSQFVLP